MTEQLHKLITKILESAQGNLLTTGEIGDQLREQYGIETSRQAVFSNLESLEKIDVVTYGLRGKERAWVLKKYAEQEASQNFNKFKDKLSFDYTQLMEKWLNQLPGNISIWAGILQRSGYEHDEEIQYTGNLPWDVENNPLLTDFKKYVEDLIKEQPDSFHHNPFSEWEQFDKKAKTFLEKRKKLVRDGIAEIIVKELVNKNRGSNQNIEVFKRVNGNIEIPMELVEGILYMLDTGVKWKAGEFSANWFNEFTRFDSIVWDYPKSKSYCYYLKKLEETIRYSQHDDAIAEIIESVDKFPRYYIFIASVQKEKQSRTNFKGEMNKRVERMLKKIGQSKWIKETTLELYEMKNELHKILDNIFSSLTKIKNIK